jgi:hypothetical protein
MRDTHPEPAHVSYTTAHDLTLVSLPLYGNSVWQGEWHGRMTMPCGTRLDAHDQLHALSTAP